MISSLLVPSQSLANLEDAYNAQENLDQFRNTVCLEMAQRKDIVAKILPDDVIMEINSKKYLIRRTMRTRSICEFGPPSLGWRVSLGGTYPDERTNPDYLNIGNGERVEIEEIGKIYKHVSYDRCLEHELKISALGTLIRKCLRRGNKYFETQFVLSKDGKKLIRYDREGTGDTSEIHKFEREVLTKTRR